MKEFSDKDIRALFEQKAHEFNPADDFDQEWNHISGRIRPPYELYTKIIISGITVIILAASYFLLEINSITRITRIEAPIKEEKSSGKNTAPIENGKKVNPSQHSKNTNPQNYSQISVVGSNDYRLKAKSATKKELDVLPDKIKYFELAELKPLTYPNTPGNIIFMNKMNHVHLENKYKEPESISKSKMDQLRCHYWIGAYYNFNKFIPNRYDETYVKDFNQSNNILNNRLGLQFLLELPQISLNSIKLIPAIGYTFLHKRFTYYRGSVYFENADELEQVSVNRFNHFLSAGLKFKNQNNYLFGVNFQRNLLQSNSTDQNIFADNILMIELAKEMHVNINRIDLNIRPNIQYGWPLSGNHSNFETIPIHIGIQLQIR